MDISRFLFKINNKIQKPRKIYSNVLNIFTESSHRESNSGLLLTKQLL
jgi:hypothetical protein